MHPSIFVALFSIVNTVSAQTPEAAADTFFQALANSDAKQLRDVIDERSANRIGKSILAAGKMFQEKGRNDFLRQIFKLVPTAEELSKMSPMDAFVAYMCDAKDAGEPAERDSLLESITFSKPKIVGVARETEDLVHVVYRISIKLEVPDYMESVPDLVTCVRSQGKWRVVLPMQVFGDYQKILLAEMDRLPESDPVPAAKGDNE